MLERVASEGEDEGLSYTHELPWICEGLVSRRHVKEREMKPQGGPHSPAGAEVQCVLACAIMRLLQAGTRSLLLVHTFLFGTTAVQTHACSNFAGGCVVVSGPFLAPIRADDWAKPGPTQLG